MGGFIHIKFKKNKLFETIPAYYFVLVSYFTTFKSSNILSRNEQKKNYVFLWK